MKKVYVVILSFVFLSSMPLAFTGDSPKPTELPKESVSAEMEFIFGPLVLRVGSPAYNWIRNLVRNEIDATGNNQFGKVGEAILKAEELPGVGGNTLLIFKLENDKVSVTRARHHFDEKEGAKAYLLDQTMGLLEIGAEHGGMYHILTAAQVMLMPFHEIVTAIMGSSTTERFSNSANAVWDSVQGPI